MNGGIKAQIMSYYDRGFSDWEIADLLEIDESFVADTIDAAELLKLQQKQHSL